MMTMRNFKKSKDEKIMRMKLNVEKNTIEKCNIEEKRSVRILRRVLEICCHSNSREQPSANAGVKNSQRSKIIIV